MAESDEQTPQDVACLVSSSLESFFIINSDQNLITARLSDAFGSMLQLFLTKNHQESTLKTVLGTQEDGA